MLYFACYTCQPVIIRHCSRCMVLQLRSTTGPTATGPCTSLSTRHVCRQQNILDNSYQWNALYNIPE